MSETNPPDIFGEGEIITFFPTVELLEAQAKYLWNKNDDYFIKVSSYQNGLMIGTNPFIYTGSISEITSKSFSKYYKFSSDDITFTYNESTAKLNVELPDKTEIKIKKPATIDSAYIAIGTVPVLGGRISYTTGNSLLLSPFKENFTTITSDFFNTTVNNYYLGIAKGVEIIKHEAGSNVVLFNSSNDFISKCLNSFDDNSSSTTFCELSPSFSLGTVVNRPCVAIDYGTTPVTFSGSETDLAYDCLFLFKSSTTDYSDAFVCYAAPFESDYYIFGISESKAMFNEDEESPLEIRDIKVKTELSWEVIII